jgi:hypothetical protein
MISVIETIQKTENEVFVRAIVEDMVQVFPATLYDPPEYGPAVCEATFELDEDELLPINEDALVDYLNQLDLDWQMVDGIDCDLE